ncbi:MAG: hypothetical protein ACKO5K_15790 [Armatimonadota bacterium]
MRADDSTRKRLLMVCIPLLVLVGLWLGSGMLTRMMDRQAEQAFQPDRREMKTISRLARLMRTVRMAIADRGKAGDWSGAIRIADEACTKDDCPEGIRALRAEALLRLGDHPKAYADYDLLLRAGSMQGLSPDPFEQRDGSEPDPSPVAKAGWLALTGKVQEYDAYRADQVGRIDPAKADALTCNNIAWAAAMMPGYPEQFAKPIALARAAVAAATATDNKPRPKRADNAAPGIPASALPKRKYLKDIPESIAPVSRVAADDPADLDRPSADLATYLNTLGVLLQRAGSNEEAIRTLTASEKLHRDPFNWPFLAKAHRALGHGDVARSWEQKLAKYLTETYGTETPNRHELLLFHDQLRW